MKIAFILTNEKGERRVVHSLAAVRKTFPLTFGDYSLEKYGYKLVSGPASSGKPISVEPIEIEE